MKKIISFGKVDAPGYGKGCEITIETTLEEGALSISGNLWMPSKKDVFMGGQCLDSLLELIPENEKMQRIVAVWKRWHLNTMRAGCEHQKSNNKNEKVVFLWRFSLTMENVRKQNAIEENVLKTLKECVVIGITDEEQKTLRLPFEVTISVFENEAPPEAPEGYELAKVYTRPNPERKTLGWLTQSEHPEGMLSRPCDVCGYKYGSAWLTEELPPEVIAEVESW